MAVEYARRATVPPLSVVVPSVPENDHRPTVRRLDAQAFDRPYEVMVVDDARLDRSAARNRGIDRATAPVVALTDDDCLPPPDWLAGIHGAFAADPDLVCLEGRVGGGSRYRGTRHYVGCNLAVRREAALDVGGFSSRYAGWREDTEFGWRMERDAPGRCTYRDDVRMCHPTVPRSPPDSRLEDLLAAEYPDRYGSIIEPNPARRLYRRARAAGLTEPVNRGLYALRRAVLGPPPECRPIPDGDGPHGTR